MTKHTTYPPDVGKYWHIFAAAVFFVTLLSVLPLFSTFGMAAEAGDLDMDGVTDAVERSNRWEVGMEVNSTRIAITSLQNSPESAQEISIVIPTTGENVNLSIRYRAYDHNDTVMGGWSLSTWVAFQFLVEYIDLNANNLYDDGDTLIQAVPFANFGPPTVETTTEPNHFSKISVALLDDVVSLEFMVGPEFVPLGGEILPAGRLLTSVDITNFPFANASSQLGLQVYLPDNQNATIMEQSEDEAAGYRADERQLSLGAGNHTALLSWEPTLFSDNTSSPLFTGNITSSPIVDNPIWNFGLGRAISYRWDFLMGVSNSYITPEDTLDETGGLFSLDALSAAVGAVGGIAVGAGGAAAVTRWMAPESISKRRYKKTKHIDADAAPSQDYNSSRSNTTSLRPEEGPNGPGAPNAVKADPAERRESRLAGSSPNVPREPPADAAPAQDYNSSRSNTTSYRAQDYNSSRSNTTSLRPEEGPNGPGASNAVKADPAERRDSRLASSSPNVPREPPADTAPAQDYNSSRSNTTSYRAQDYNSSRSNTTSLRPQEDHGGPAHRPNAVKADPAERQDSRVAGSSPNVSKEDKASKPNADSTDQDR